MINLKNMDKKSKQRFLAGAALFVVAILVVAAIAVYIYAPEEESEKEQEEIMEVDHRISPEHNQGLIVEVNRIRHRGLTNEILSRGSSWKNKPSFYYIAEIDGLEYSSKDIFASGAENEQLFNGWDTMLQEKRIMKDIKEEQETSKVTIAIVERTSSGLFGFRSQDEQKEKFAVTYDYKTGRWTGKDFLMDDDGYGHYVGEFFEVWFNVYQSDLDHDGIPHWIEVNVLGTDPHVDDSMMDPDGDGIPTSWEWKWDYDPFVWNDHRKLDPDIDGIENIEEYQMRKWYANPYQQDIYIEADGMEKNSFIDKAHEFHEETQQIIIERYAQRGINCYIDYGWPDGPHNGGGELLPHIDTISQDSGDMLQFYNHHFADERKGIFRYMIIAHNAGFNIPSTFNNYDTAVIDSSHNKHIRRLAFTARTQRIVLASAALHELGHSLGIAPWTIEGCDNISYTSKEYEDQYEETWANYHSAMNYMYIWDKSLADYSDGSRGEYDQKDEEHFFLPYFEIESEVMEDPLIHPPGTDYLVYDEPVINKELAYDEELTQQYTSGIHKIDYVENVDCDYAIYVDSSDTDGHRNVKIYAKPQVKPTFTIWTLVQEGYMDYNGALQFYSINDIIDDISS